MDVVVHARWLRSDHARLEGLDKALRTRAGPDKTHKRAYWPTEDLPLDAGCSHRGWR